LNSPEICEMLADVMAIQFSLRLEGLTLILCYVIGLCVHIYIDGCFCVLCVCVCVCVCVYVCVCVQKEAGAVCSTHRSSQESYTIFTWYPKGKIHLGRRVWRWEGIDEMDLKALLLRSLDWNIMAQD
jgi:hypothetical protein